MFVTLDKMKEYVGETTNTYDQFLTDQIVLIGDTIDNYCGRKLEEASYTQSFYRTDFEEDNAFYLFHYPVGTLTSVSEVNTDSVGVDTTTVLESYDYRLKDDSGLLTRIRNGLRSSWYACLDINSRIDVVFTAGYSTIPLPIQDAVCSLVADRYFKKVNGISLGFGSDVQRLSVPGVFSIDFDYTLTNNTRASSFGMILGSYGNVLDHYRSERALVGEIKENYVS